MPKPAAPGQPAAPAPGGPGRYVAIFVDDLHIAPGNLDYSKEALRRFVAEFLGPDDKVAIVTSSGPGGVQQLTQDRAALGAAIDRLAVRQANVAPARGSQMTGAQAELILRGDPNALQLATRLMMDEPGSVLSGQAPQAAVEAAGGYNPASVIDAKDRAPRRRSVARPAASSPRSCASPRSLSPSSTTSCAAWPRSPAARSACWSRTASSSGWARATSRPATCARSSTRPRARGRSSTRSTRAASPRPGATPPPPALRCRRVCGSAWTVSRRRSSARRSRGSRTTRAGSWCAGRTSSPRACGGCWRTTTPTTSWHTSRPTRSATAGSARSRSGSHGTPGSWCARARATSLRTIASANGPRGPLSGRRRAQSPRP